jgi:hypothetical protein
MLMDAPDIFVVRPKERNAVGLDSLARELVGVSFFSATASILGRTASDAKR